MPDVYYHKNSDLNAPCLPGDRLIFVNVRGVYDLENARRTAIINDYMDTHFPDVGYAVHNYQRPAPAVSDLRRLDDTRRVVLTLSKEVFGGPEIFPLRFGKYGALPSWGDAADVLRHLESLERLPPTSIIVDPIGVSCPNEPTLPEGTIKLRLANSPEVWMRCAEGILNDAVRRVQSLPSLALRY